MEVFKKRPGAVRPAKGGSAAASLQGQWALGPDGRPRQTEADWWSWAEYTYEDIKEKVNCVTEASKTLDNTGQTILHRLAGRSVTEVKDLAASMCHVIRTGAIVNITTRTKHRDTPLHQAVLRSDGDAAARVLIAHGADVNAVLSDGNTPLLCALETASNQGRPGSLTKGIEWVELVDHLVKAGADPTRENSYGHNAMDIIEAGEMEGALRAIIMGAPTSPAEIQEYLASDAARCPSCGCHAKGY